MTRPTPLRPLRCRHPDCTLPEGGRCAREAEFADPLAECDELERTSATEALPASVRGASLPPSPADTDTDAAPWRGRNLTLNEAETMVRRSPARLLSVLGPHDAGKTSLMASFFLQIASGQYGAFPYRFASSRTLYGFQDFVKRANRWSGKPGEQIVGHTPKEDSPDAGRFLHLGLRPRNPADDRHVDVLLSDVPGEWVEDWAQRDDEDARRRLAFVSRSDGFVVVVDAFKLLERGGGRLDARIGGLIRRIADLSSARSRRPALALVFAKIDRVLDRFASPANDAGSKREEWGALGKASRAIWASLDHAREKGFEVVAFAVSAFPTPLADGQPLGVMDPFVHVMASADLRDRWPRLVVPVPDSASYFQAMRRPETES